MTYESAPAASSEPKTPYQIGRERSPSVAATMSESSASVHGWVSKASSAARTPRLGRSVSSNKPSNVAPARVKDALSENRRSGHLNRLGVITDLEKHPHWVQIIL